MRQVHAPVVQQFGKTRELLVGRALGAFDFAETLLDEGAVVVVAAFVTGHGEDASSGRQLAVAERLEQRGHQFAPRQVAGATEEDEIEGHAGPRKRKEVGSSIAGSCAERVTQFHKI
jgi:hypothetical protein